MRIQRTISPAVAPLNWRDVLYACTGPFRGQRALSAFEAELREYFGVRHVFLVSSGKAALTLILLGLKDLSSRDEVVIPAYTCYSVPSSVLKSGLKLSPCDIDASTFDFDPASLDGMVTDRTLCVVPCHLFGIAADMDRIRRVCSERGAYVVEDAAQAMGGTYKRRKLGTIGDVGLFSLGRGKNITCGSGGIILTNSDRIAGAIRTHYEQLEAPSLLESLGEWIRLLFMAVFIHPALYWLPAGLSVLKLGETVFPKDFPLRKLSAMQAASLHDWKTRLEQSNKSRAVNGRYFEQRLGASREVGREDPLPYLRFPVLVGGKQRRDWIFARSNEQGLGVSLMYPKAVHQIEEIKADFRGMTFPTAENVADRLVALPTHSYLSDSDRDAICKLLMGIEEPVFAKEHEAGVGQSCP
jgi:dTDP-4-amino-4,6-dideoxygalactose transaminase